MEKRATVSDHAPGVGTIRRAFFIVGPTAVGKSELAADAAARFGGEIVSADAFQIYRGLDLLSAKPDIATLGKAPHHLIGVVPLTEEMNAEKFRSKAVTTIAEIELRHRHALVVGGSGLYVKALTHGLLRMPLVNEQLRRDLNGLDLSQLREQLVYLDPNIGNTIDLKNRRRVVRALEICLLTGRPASEQRPKWPAEAQSAETGSSSAPRGVFLFRDRADLYRRINERVEAIFAHGAVDEVRAAGRIGATASHMIGLADIHQLLAGEISLSQCISRIQLATRRYAKRQLTWFARQSNLEPLNLTLLSYGEAVHGIRQRISLLCPQG